MEDFAGFVLEPVVPHIIVPPRVTECAFNYVDLVKTFINTLPPHDGPKYLADGSPWFTKLVGYDKLVAAYRECASESIDPKENRHMVNALDRVSVGLVSLLHQFFSQYIGSAKVLVMSDSSGADLVRLSYAGGFKVSSVDYVCSDDVDIREYRVTTGYQGVSYFSLDQVPSSNRYDLIISHNNIHHSCSNYISANSFFKIVAYLLSESGKMIGTYPNASQAQLFDGIGCFTFVNIEPSCDESDKGFCTVRIGSRTWRDPVVTTSDFENYSYIHSLNFNSFNLRETYMVAKDYTPPKMSDYGQYPELGYFRAFVLCKDFPKVMVGPKPKIPFSHWDVYSDYPIDVVKCREWINYGAPLTVPDSSFLYFTDYYIKDKSDGELGVLVCFDYKVYLVTQKHVYYGGVVGVPDCSIQVEFVNVDTDTFRLYLSDPLRLLGLPFATTFSQRLRKYREWCSVYPELNSIVDLWLVLNKDSLEKCWIEAGEGIVLQCFDALPVSYNSGKDRRGSMRYVKRTPTVDVSPHVTVDVCCGNNRYRISNTYDHVYEFLLSDIGPVPHRPRPDKTIGNTDVYISKLADLVGYQVLKVIIANRLLDPVVLDVTDSSLTDPVFSGPVDYTYWPVEWVL